MKIKSLDEIVKGQKEFQKMIGFPVDSIVAKDRNQMAEMYLFKTIEEIVELRKEFPSVMNEWSKTQKNEDMSRVNEEFADILLFLINFINVWRITQEDIMETLTKVQDNNFTKIKEKKMGILNVEIMKVPDPIVSPGTGNINPRFIFVGQNPGQDLKKGEIAFKQPVRNSGKVLRDILEDLGVDGECYFTNLVKVPTEGNAQPTKDQTEFWYEFLDREIEILRYNNPGVKVITLGKWTSEQLFGCHPVSHPARVLRGSITRESYKEELKKIICE